MIAYGRNANVEQHKCGQKQKGERNQCNNHGHDKTHVYSTSADCRVHQLIIQSRK